MWKISTDTSTVNNSLNMATRVAVITKIHK